MSSKKEENSHRPRSRSRSSSRSKSRSYSPRSRSRSRSRSPVRRKRSYSRSYSRSRSRSRDRYRSRSCSPYRRRSYSPYRKRGWRSRSTSRSPMSNRRRHIGNRFNPERNNVIGVFGLSLYTNEKDLREIFEKYGAIQEVQVVYDHNTHRSRGFAFVYFEDVEDAVEAKESCNGIEIDGRKIRVDYSITKRAHTPTPGVYMGKPTRPARERDRYDDYDRDYGGRYSSRY